MAVAVSASSPARIEAHIKQLCCLGLGGESVMPALLRELHALIPSYSNTFFFSNENCELVNICDECPESIVVGPLYIEEFYNRREREVHPGFSQTMRHDHGVVRDEKALTVDKKSFYNSDLYNLIFRSLGYHSFLRLMVREGGRPLGALQIWRGPKDRPFTVAEERTLARLEPFIAHALTETGALNGPLVESGENGMVIANRKGHVIYLSPQGRRLLFLATNSRIAPGSVRHEPARLPPAVSLLCRDLAGLFSGDASAPPPMLQHRNVWGAFTFRAYRLEATEDVPSLIGITVSHQEPLPLKLMSGIRELPLSPRQSEICLMLASGKSHGAIARQLNISRHTVIAHSRWIYGKLDVHDRAELLNKLLSASSKRLAAQI